MLPINGFDALPYGSPKLAVYTVPGTQVPMGWKVV